MEHAEHGNLTRLWNINLKPADLIFSGFGSF